MSFRRNAALVATVAEQMGDSEGWAWRVQILKPGFANGKPRVIFSEDVVADLSEMLSQDNNLPTYMHGRSQHGYSWEDYSEQDRCGWAADFELDDDGIANGVFYISKNDLGTDLRATLMDAEERGNEAFFGLSIFYDFEGDWLWTEGPDGVDRGYVEVSKITAVHALDVVRKGAASDGFMGRLSNTEGDDEMDRDQLIALLKARGITVPDNATDEDVTGLLAEHLPAANTGGTADDPPPANTGGTADDPPPANTGGTADDPPPANTGGRADGGLEAQVRSLQEQNARSEFRAALAESGLPDVFQTEARQEFQGLLADGVVDEEGIPNLIARYKRLHEAAPPGNPLSLGRRIDIGDDERTKHGKAMMGLVLGEDQDKVPAFHGLKHAFAVMGGSHNGVVDPYAMMREANFMGALIGAHDEQTRTQIQSAWAAIRTTTFGDALGDSLHRMLIQAYGQDDMMVWQEVVAPADIVPINDFRSHDLARIGGYGILPEISEGEPYQQLADPDDEHETLQIMKRGGIIKITFETFANDDIGTIRRLVSNLGYAASITLCYVVYSLWTDPPMMGDGQDAFGNTHNNLLTAALSDSALRSAQQKMRGQSPYGIDDVRLARTNDPAKLLVPTDLGTVADDIVMSEYRVDNSNPDSNQRNEFKGRLKTVMVPTWTDANDWAVTADPTRAPVVKLGFYLNRRDPEIHTADTPMNYATLHSDEIEVRLRHIYGASLIDWRTSVFSRVA